MAADADGAVLARALDQVADLLAGVRPETSGGATPCERWTVQDLVDHLVATPGTLAAMARGDSIDPSAAAPPAGDDPAGTFRASSDELLRAVREPGAAGAGVDWQCAELAVHTWDLARALGRPTRGLDPEVAERGLDFMLTNLTTERRGTVFGPEQVPPDGADAYERIAAFAGRTV